MRPPSRQPPARKEAPRPTNLGLEPEGVASSNPIPLMVNPAEPSSATVTTRVDPPGNCPTGIGIVPKSTAGASISTDGSPPEPLRRAIALGVF
jgi:hypothetical protein